MTRLRLLIVLLLLIPALPVAAQHYGRAPEEYPDAAYLGAGMMNDLVGPHIEVANPIGSIWILVGRHLSAPGKAHYEQGSENGFNAGIRFFSGGRGLQSGWYGSLMGGTMDVDHGREGGRRIAYQRLGFGISLGYQYVGTHLRAGFGLGAAYLEPYRLTDEERVERDYSPLVEGTIGWRF